ncbi:unnamed protein product, partial [Closterium sp. NIES-53]
PSLMANPMPSPSPLPPTIDTSSIDKLLLAADKCAINWYSFVGSIRRVLTNAWIPPYRVLDVVLRRPHALPPTEPDHPGKTPPLPPPPGDPPLEPELLTAADQATADADFIMRRRAYLIRKAKYDAAADAYAQAVAGRNAHLAVVAKYNDDMTTLTPKFIAWSAADNCACNVILGALPDSLMRRFQARELRASVIWAELHAMFERRDISSVGILFQQQQLFQQQPPQQQQQQQQQPPWGPWLPPQWGPSTPPWQQQQLNLSAAATAAQTPPAPLWGAPPPPGSIVTPLTQERCWYTHTPLSSLSTGDFTRTAVQQQQQPPQQQGQQQPGQQQGQQLGQQQGQQQQEEQQPQQQQGLQQHQQQQRRRATARSSPFLLPRMHTRSLDPILGTPPSPSLNLLEDFHEELTMVQRHTPSLTPLYPGFLGALILAAVSAPTIFVPSTFQEATTCLDADKWIAAIFLECEAFIRNDSFIDVPLPPDANLVEG